MEPSVKGDQNTFHSSNELRKGVLFARKKNLGVVSVLHHVRLRSEEGEVVGKNLEEEWTEGGTLEDADRIRERIGEESVPTPVSCTN